MNGTLVYLVEPSLLIYVWSGTRQVEESEGVQGPFFCAHNCCCFENIDWMPRLFKAATTIIGCSCESILSRDMYQWHYLNLQFKRGVKVLMVVTARTRDGSAGISAGVVTDDLRVGTFDCNHSSPSSSSNRLLSIFRWHPKNRRLVPVAEISLSLCPIRKFQFCTILIVVRIVVPPFG